MKKVIAILMLSVLLLCCSSSAFADYSSPALSGVYSDWSSNPTGYANWNCYGYAIGAYQNIDPGTLSGYGVSYINMTFSQFKAAIIQDLSYLGYTNISEVSSGYVLQPGERLIAFISGTWFEYGATYSSDVSQNDTGVRFEGKNYHFLVKYTNGGGWFHKFGTSSAIMKLKSGYTPSNIAYTDEKFISSSVYYAASSYCQSFSIGYIKFQTGVPISSADEWVIG